MSEKTSLQELRDKLRKRIDEKNLSRTCLEARMKEEESLELSLKNTRNKKKRVEIRKRLTLLRDIREKELDQNEPDPIETD